MIRAAALAFLAGLLVLAALAWAGGTGLAHLAESRAEGRLALALRAAGEPWAQGEADGLRLAVAGEAPDAARRDRVLALAHAIAGPGLVDDRTSLAPPPVPVPVAPALLILRNGLSLTLSGRIPGDGSRARIATRLAAAGPGTVIVDATAPDDSAEAAEGWAVALTLGLEAAVALDRARIEVAPCALRVQGVAPDGAARRRLLDLLRTGGPCLGSAEILIPRPLVTPYVFDLALGPGGPVLRACAAPDAGARQRILAALVDLGAAAPVCPEAAGAPSLHWAEAVTLSTRLLAEVGAGRILIADAEVRFDPAPGLDRDALLTLRARLAASLPPPFALSPLPEDAATVAPQDAPSRPPVRFTAARAADGTVTLWGHLPAAAARQAVASYAANLFGTGHVRDRTRGEPSVPDGWTGRVLAGLDALALLDEGRVAIGPARIAVEGRTAEADGEAEIRRILARVAGPETDVAVSLVHVPRTEPASLLAPDACLAALAATLAARQIVFAASEAAIAPASAPVLDRMAEILRSCAPVRIEIGGHTETSGGTEKNLALSKARAEAVIDALLARGVDLDRLVANGYGESTPVADNATEEGRMANRRIGVRIVAEKDSVEESDDRE